MSMTYKIQGDGSYHVKGSLELDDRDVAISVITGIMEAFDIESHELGY